ncbi:MAG: DUF3347 domain-containing protein [Planctomycetes bacterium]|nr:DUF3347 domain-containing protein [Planctomycetota bacterium]
MSPSTKMGRMKQVLTAGGHWGHLLRLVVVFLLGYFVHHFWAGSESAAPAAPAGSSEQKAEEGESKPQIWTCSMHPQIQQPKPGKCPLCGMDLIPLTSGGKKRTALRQLIVSPEARALMNIQVSPVERKFVEAEVRMVGKVDYDETRLRYITAWVSGRLDRLYVDYTGVQVQKGDHMVYIYSEELYAAQQELIEAIKTARKRGKPSTFFDTGGVDLVASSREKLRLLGLTDEQIAEIEKRVRPSDHMTIYAPIGGIVIEKLRQEGDRVRVGDRIYTIADLTQVWVKMDAYESDLVWVRYGQKVVFETEAYPGEAFEGRIAFIDPVLDDRTRTVKVRVNVPNPDLKLKPEMFVRGTVRARVATGGRVVDPEMAGKWMCPMHPEVVEDGPGVCHVCQMPLVRAETLGFTTVEESEEIKPLVIPVTAALVTGTRAIVYVEDPNADEPTFEGREIVLGPRAGDYYIVRHGLQEGELVVTNGNFKIDSEIQIQARPSMMTPEGSAEVAEGELIDVPFSFRRRLKPLLEAYHAIVAAEQEEDLPSLRQAFRSAGDALAGLDADALEGEDKLLWKELAMLLGNDAFEGSEAKTWKEAKRLAERFRKNWNRLDAHFRVAQQVEQVPKRLNVPESFQKQLVPLWQTYVAIGEALAKDDAQAAQQAAQKLMPILDGIDMKLLSDQKAHMAWMKELENLKTIAESLGAAKDIKDLRGQFASLSSEMQVLAIQFGFGKGVTVYLHHCPMAFGGKGAAWLQPDDDTRNPYYGESMLKCADRVEKIGAEP